MPFHFRPRVGIGWFPFNFERIGGIANFRPRLGMGWFNAVMAVWGDNPTFSSPSGDGLVLHYPEKAIAIVQIFVPEWGWVGSHQP